MNKKSYLLFLLIFFFRLTHAQQPAFYMNQGLINDNAIIVESKNMMICYPNGQGNLIMVGDQVSLWDITTGRVLKNIPVGNKILQKVSVCDDKYLLLEFQDDWEIFSLSSFALLKTFPHAPFNTACMLIADNFFISDDTKTTRYNLNKPSSTGLFMKNIGGYQDWDVKRISKNELFVLRNDTIKMVDLSTDQVTGLFKNENYGLCWPVANGSKLLVSVEEPGKPKMIGLYDLRTRKLISKVIIPFKDYAYYSLSKDGNTLLIPSDHYTYANFSGGYKILKVSVVPAGLQSSLIQLQSLTNLNNFSVVDETWKYGIYALSSHYDQTVYVYDSNTGKTTSFSNMGDLPKVDVINKNLLILGNHNTGKTTLVNLPTGKNQFLRENKIFTFNNELKSSSFNLLVKDDKTRYSFVCYSSNFTRVGVFAFRTLSLKVYPVYNSRVGNELSFTINLKGDNLQETDQLSSPFNAHNVYQFNYDLGSGAVNFFNYPNLTTDLSKSFMVGNDVYCLFKTEVQQFTNNAVVDSVFVYGCNDKKLLLSVSSSDLNKKTGLLFPYIQNIALRSDKKALLICGSNRELYQLEINDCAIEGVMKIPFKSDADNQFGYCNNDKYIYEIGQDSLFIFDAKTGSEINRIAGEFSPENISRINADLIWIDHKLRVIDLGNMLANDPPKQIDWKNKYFSEINVGLSSYDHVAYTFEGAGYLRIINSSTGKVIVDTVCLFSKPGKFINSSDYLFFNASGRPQILNYKTNSIKSFNTDLPIGELEGFSCNPADSILLSTSVNNLYVWDLGKRKLLYNLILPDTISYFLQDNTGHYTYNRLNAAQIIARVNDKWFDPQNLDYLYNRPDLFAMDSVSRNFYYGLYKKRLAHDKINQNISLPGSHPECLVVDDLGQKSNISPTASLIFHLRANSSNSLKKVFVYINEVPVLIKSLPPTKSDHTDLPIQLEKGENRITAYYIDVNGAESNLIEKVWYYNGQETTVPQTYFVGIGLSHYKSAQMDLKYAVKDVQCLDSLLVTKTKAAIIICFY